MHGTHYLTTRGDRRTAVQAMSALFVAAVLLPASVTSVLDAFPTKYPGWIGPFHSSAGAVWGGENVANGSTLWEAFHFGTSCIENSAEDEGFELKQSIEFHCGEANSNSIWGMLIPPTEGGTINNPNDTSLWQPVRPWGLIQGAARWSKLSMRCPQIAGVQIDDFLGNYRGNTSRPKGPCVKCPSSHPYHYGGSAPGDYCCPVPEAAKGTCPGGLECCIRPGSTEGCQGVARCGINPHNNSVCEDPKGMGITLQEAMDVKAALLGKTVRNDGTVDHDSIPQTPHLRLLTTWYASETAEFASRFGKDDGLFDVIDGANLWIVPQTVDAAQTYTQDVAALRELLPASKTIIAGDYMLYDLPDWEDPQSFFSIVSQSLQLYDRGEIEACFLFAGVWFTAQYMNNTFWNRLQLPHWMDEYYYPHLGAVQGVVMSSNGDTLVAGAVVVAKYNGTQFVSRRVTDQQGRFNFSGWAGITGATPHTLEIYDPRHQSWSGAVQIKAQATVNVHAQLQGLVLPTHRQHGVTVQVLKSDDLDRSTTPRSKHFVTYSSRLPRNGSHGEDGFNWTLPCFRTGDNAFSAGSIDWEGKGIPECAVDDPPLHCFTDPERVKDCLDRMPVGRRAIHLQGGIWLYGKHSVTNRKQCGGWADWDDELEGGCTLWADNWQGIVSQRFDHWFSRYKDLGGTVDVIMLDFETTPWWEAEDFYHERLDLNRTLADPRWPAVLAELNSRGAVYNVNFTHGIQDIVSWGSSHYDKDWRKWVWVDVMGARRGQYLNASLYFPVRKHFPKVKGLDYDHHQHPGPGPHWTGGYTGITTPPVCCGSHVGTHSSGAYYGETAVRNGVPTALAWSTPASVDGTFQAMNITAPTTPFNMLLSYVRRARGETLVVHPPVPLMPWVQPKNSSWYSKLCRTAPCGSNHSVLALDGAYEEMIFHLALSGVSEFLWYRAGSEWPTEGIADFSEVLSELDAVIGRASAPNDARSLADIISFDDEYLISGHPTRSGTVAFRFSPRNMSQTTVLGKSPATFQLPNGSRVIPVPAGRILELPHTVGTNGYWITT